jgi:hypothetical protein
MSQKYEHLKALITTLLAAVAGALAQEPAAPAWTVYPDDAYSRPQVDRRNVFETGCGVAPMGDVEWRATTYAQCDLRLMTRAGQPRSSLRVATKERPTVHLVVTDRVRRAPTEVRFTLRNLGPTPVRVGLVLDEMPWQPIRENSGASWAIGTTIEVAPGPEQELCYRFADSRALTPGALSAPRWPSNCLRIDLEGLRPGTLHEFELAALTVVYPLPSGVDAATLRAPAQITAGKRFAVAVQTTAALAGRDVCIEARRAERVLWRRRLTTAEVATLGHGTCRLDSDGPDWIASGPLTFGLTVDGLRVPNAEALTTYTNRTKPGLPRTERRLHHGVPTPFLNGKPLLWQGYASYDFQPGNVSQFGAHGATVFCIAVAAGRHIHNVTSPTLLAPDVWDFAELEEQVGMALQANPQAALFLRTSLALPPFWLQEHESELVRIRTPQGDLIWEESGATRAASLASAVWQRDQEAALRALIAYAKAQPWSRHLAGIWLMCEVTEEWFAWGCNDGKWSDYSAPMQKAFRAWLTARTLPGADEDTPIPAPSLRSLPGADLYPDTPDGRRAALFHRFLNEITATTLSRFAKVVKQETAGRTLTGAFLGYVIQLAGEPRQAMSGQFGLRAILDDPNLDLLAGIPLHDFRLLHGGANPPVTATRSIQAAGKFYCNENDLFSWLHPLIWNTPYAASDPRAAAIQMHRRECAADLADGYVSQRFSLMATWHHDEALQHEFGNLARLAARALERDRTAADEIAFLVDDTSFAWFPPESTLQVATHKRLLRDLMLTGAPVGVWLLSDLNRIPARVKLVVIAGAQAATAADLAALQTAVERGGRTLLVVGAAGRVDPDTGAWRPENPARLLGLPADADGERELPAGGRLLWRASPPTTGLRELAERAGVHCYAPAGYVVHASAGLLSVTCSTATSPARLRWPQAVHVLDEFSDWQGQGREFDCPFEPAQTRLFSVSE